MIPPIIAPAIANLIKSSAKLIEALNKLNMNDSIDRMNEKNPFITLIS